MKVKISRHDGLYGAWRKDWTGLWTLEGFFKTPSGAAQYLYSLTGAGR